MESQHSSDRSQRTLTSRRQSTLTEKTYHRGAPRSRLPTTNPHRGTHATQPRRAHHRTSRPDPTATTDSQPTMGALPHQTQRYRQSSPARSHGPFGIFGRTQRAATPSLSDTLQRPGSGRWCSPCDSVPHGECSTTRSRRCRSRTRRQHGRYRADRMICSGNAFLPSGFPRKCSRALLPHRAGGFEDVNQATAIGHVDLVGYE